MTTFNMLTRPSRQAVALTTADLHRVAPSIFTDHAMVGLSDRYAFISTETVLTAMQDAGFVPVRAAEAMVRRANGEGYAKHMVTFRHRDNMDNAMVRVGDTVPEIAMLNSHDGTGSYVMNAGLFRLVCANGLIVSDASFASLKVRHIGAATPGKVIDAAFTIIEDMPRIQNDVAEWQALALPRPAQEAFANAAMSLRWGNESAPVSTAEILRPRRYGDHGANLWQTFNAVQENVIRGGISGRNANMRRTTTRAVNAPAENVRLNKAIWTLAATVAKVMKEGDKALESLRVAA